VEPGVRVAVYDWNQQGKNAVFFIHGWPIDHNMFEYQFNILPQNGYRCISMDLRGFGKSDAPWTGYTYDRMADDVYEVIKTLNVPRLTLVGFSMGGAIAIRYMARHRGYKVSKLALWSAAAPSFTRRPDYPYGMTADQICPFEFALEMNQGIRNSQIYKFDKSGHGAFYDQMEKFTQEFSGFLRQ